MHSICSWSAPWDWRRPNRPRQPFCAKCTSLACSSFPVSRLSTYLPCPRRREQADKPGLLAGRELSVFGGSRRRSGRPRLRRFAAAAAVAGANRIDETPQRIGVYHPGYAAGRRQRGASLSHPAAGVPGSRFLARRSLMVSKSSACIVSPVSAFDLHASAAVMLLVKTAHAAPSSEYPAMLQ